MNLEIKVGHEIIGEIKPLHACVGGPKTGGPYLPNDVSNIFNEIGIPSCRLHDIEGVYGMNQFVDIHCIFPNFDANENDENNYNFTMTDKYLTAIKNCGSQIYYRLGETIDHFDKKLFINPPKDFLKWAKICEHVIRHYNEGWANGYHMDIKHWEIWGEPEGKKLWGGTNKQFYELYTITAKHLKSCFPNIKIGGYSAVGFYSLTRDWDRPWFNSIIPFMDGFFDYIKGKDVPLDFFSWHCYALSPEEVSRSCEIIRAYLDNKGYTKTESHLVEFNMFYSLREPDWPQITLAQHEEHASDILSTLIECSDANVDMLFYYDLRGGNTNYNGVYHNDTLFGKIELLPGFYSLKFFGDLYRLKNRIKIDYEKDNGLYSLGATDGDNTVVIISNREYDGRIIFTTDAKKIELTDISGKLTNRKCIIKNNVLYSNNEKYIFEAQKNHIYRIELK